MRAIVYDKKAQPFRLVERDLPIPEPMRGELRVRVLAASVNAADWRSMKLGIIPRSRVFGADVCGIVDSIGLGVRGWKAGDAVVGDLSNYGFGGFAEFACASAEAFVGKPEGLGALDACAVPLAAVTALQALRLGGSPGAGADVLVVGASGGVGSFAVQLAKLSGARVTAVTSGGNANAVMALGADRVIDYAGDGFARADDRFDLVLAVHGNASIGTYRRLLKPRGTCVVVGGSLRQVFAALLLGPLLSRGGRKHRALSARSNAADLSHVLDLAAAGTVVSPIERVYAFNEIPQAMDYAQRGHAKGKLVIDYKEA